MDFVVVVGERRRVPGGAGLRRGFASPPQSDGGQNAEDVHVIVHGPGKDAVQAVGSWLRVQGSGPTNQFK